MRDLLEVRATLAAWFAEARRIGFEVGQWEGELARACVEIDYVRPMVVAEIGVCALGWPFVIAPFCGLRFEYFGLDPNDRGDRPKARAALEGIGARVNVFSARSESPQAQEAMPQRIDLLHIDGDHAKDSVLRDFDLYARRVRAGGLIILHDTASRKGPGEALAAILDGRAARIAEVISVYEPGHPWNMGLTVLRMK